MEVFILFETNLSLLICISVLLIVKKYGIQSEFHVHLYLQTSTPGSTSSTASTATPDITPPEQKKQNM